MEKTIKYEIIEDLDFPCADISYEWRSEKNAKLVVLMHFSRVISGYKSDIEITFKNPWALKWEEESFGLIDIPEPLPRCSNNNFSGWTHPTLIVKDSKWAEKYSNRMYAAGDPKAKDVTHYVFVAMNDLLHVLSEQKPLVKLVLANNA